MATLYKPDGSSLTVNPLGRSFTLEEMYQHIGCRYVQRIGLPDGRSMWVDEDGKYNDKLKRNDLATKLLLLAGGFHDDEVVGNVLLASPEESGDRSGDGEEDGS